MKVINENEGFICSASRLLRGELIVDGYGVLHELYEKYKLDWANGGCYAEQHRVTKEYFGALVKAGVKPIVVVDGGGCATHHDDTVHRRQQEIQKIPECIRDRHNGTSFRHTLPIVAREIFVYSLKEANIDVYVADGKAIKTIVYMANHYSCPILTNNTYYCVCNVRGVVFFKNLDVSSCRVVVYEQTKLVEFLKFSNPDLVYAVVAVIGDGSEKSVPYLYHGRIRAKIMECVRDHFSGRSYVLDVVDFLSAKKIKSFADFEHNLKWLNFGRMCEILSENCQRVKTVYVHNYATMQTLSIEELKASTNIECSKPCHLPVPILEAYRSGTFPVLAVNAMTIGKCVLEQMVGDEEQPPPPVLGCPVRQLMYGLVSSLLNKKGQAGILEFHRTYDNLEYKAHKVTPKCEHKELLVTNIYTLDKEVRKKLAVQAICKVLQCPEDIVHKLEGESDRSLSLVTLVTRRWAQYIIEREPMPNPIQLVKALVVNFFFNLTDPEAYRQPSIDESKFSDPDWIKAYHALLEWQSLYRNVCSLNSMLCHPLQMLSPSFLFDGPLVIFLALHPSPDIIDTYVRKLDASKKAQYKKVFDLVIIQ